MIRGSPSRTALGAALYRAAHQLVDRPLVLDDPLALPILGRGDAALDAELRRRASPAAAPLRAFVAVRSRFAEDRLAAAHARGVRQYVVLGAGLDTLAYRCRLDALRVVEVDHPDTQAWKRERLARAGIAVPPGVAYAAADLARETARDALARTRFDAAAPAVIAWLGVTPYLTPDAVVATLRAVARVLAAGTEIAFDFAAPEAGAGRDALASRVAAAGEPFRSAFAPAALEAELRGLGFSAVELDDAAGLGARYLAGRADGLALTGGHVAVARV